MSVEKHVAKMDDAHIASSLRAAVNAMPAPVLHALVASIFDAFRDRGESSEDAAEGADTALESIERGEHQAIVALLNYGSENPGLLKEALRVFEEGHAALVSSLPAALLPKLDRAIRVE